MKLKNILAISALVMSQALASAQVNTLLGISPDAATAGMSGNQYGEARGMFIYSNPTSLLYGEKDWAVSAATVIMPKAEDLDSRDMMYGAAVSRRFGNHGVHVGFRYLGGLSIPVDGEGNVKPRDLTFDLGYSFRFLDHFSVSAVTSVINDKIVDDATGVAFNVGAYYRNSFDMGINADYVVGVSGFNIGPKLNYGATSSKLPAGVGAGGELGLDFNEKNRLNVSVAGQYRYLNENGNIGSWNIGAEYGFNKMLFARGGYRYGGHDSSGYSFGLGVRVGTVSLDLCHQRGIKGNETKLTWIGLNIAF